MKKLFSDNTMDVIEFKNGKKDIMEIKMINNAKLRNKKTKELYFNDNFIMITNRKGDIRLIDLFFKLDITNILNKYELVCDKKTTEEVIFMGY